MTFLEELGAVFADLSPTAGNAREVDGLYSSYFAENSVAAVVNRPDFYVFGATASLAGLGELIDDLERQLTRSAVSPTAGE